MLVADEQISDHRALIVVSFREGSLKVPEQTQVIDLEGFNKIVRGRDATYLVNENDTYVGQALLNYGEYGQREYELLSAITSQGCVIAEVGANMGAHTVRLAKHVGMQGRVIAYEPQPVIFQSLCGTIALNSLMNVDCYPYALSSETGRLVIPAMDYRKQNNFGGLSFVTTPEQGLHVPLNRFDDVFALPRLDLMKIDVEGMELNVLKGAETMINKFRPIIYMENDRKEKSPELLQWLFDHDYRIWWHTPALFNADNFFQKDENIYGDVCSLNVLAIRRDADVNIVLSEITDPNAFPNVG